MLLKSKVQFFLFHIYIKWAQSKFFEQLKTDVTNEKIVVQVDFAENFNLKEQNEIFLNSSLEHGTIEYIYCFCLVEERKFRFCITIIEYFA